MALPIDAPMNRQVIERVPLNLTFVESQSLASSFLNNLPGMIYHCRNVPDWTMETVTEGCYELTGYTSFELIENQLISYGQIIHLDDRSVVWNQVQFALQQQRPFEIVYRIHTRDNQIKWVRENGQGIYDSAGNVVGLEGLIMDITNLISAEEKIQKQTQQFQALRNIDMAISASFDLRLVLNILLEQVTNQLDVDAADFLISKHASGNLEYTTGRGFRTNALRNTHLLFGEGFAGKAVLNRQIIHIPDLRESPGKLLLPKSFIDEGFITYICIPLIAKGQVRGILEVFHRSRKDVDADWLNFLETLSGYAAIALDNASLFDDLQKTNTELTLAYDATLDGWVKTLELRDKQSLTNAQRVIDMTLRLAKMLGVGEDQLPHIRRGAMLHDIGKMGIPDSILQKPGPLTHSEWEIMHRHPTYAFELLSTIDYLRPAIPIPYCHHENWDGSGYPRGLKGEEIPLSARIFAVPNVWGALTSERSYRPSWSNQEALVYIAEQSGKLFDPKVTEAFFLIVQEYSTELHK